MNKDSAPATIYPAMRRIAAAINRNAPEKHPLTPDLLWSLCVEVFCTLETSRKEGNDDFETDHRFNDVILDEIYAGCSNRAEFEQIRRLSLVAGRSHSREAN